MSRDGFDWFSIVASIVGFPSAIGLCFVFWKKASYAYHVPRYRAEARIRIDLLHRDIGRHQGGQEPSVPVPPVLRRRIKATEQSLESLQKNENCLWARWSCLWRPDVTLEFLNQLEKDLEVIVLQLSANRGVASQPTSQTTPPAEAPLPESQSPPAPVIDQQTPRAAAASPFSNLQTSGPPDLPPPSTLRHRNIATNQSISTYVNPTPKHHPRNHGSVTTHPYTRLSFRKRTPPAAEYEWTPDIQLIYARYFAERGEPEAVNLLRLPPVTVPQHRNIAPIVERTDLEILAQQLNEYLETHPVEPIIGSIDNPFPLADKYGIKGLSVLSALIHYLDEGIFTCRFCHHTDTAIDHALLHQRAMRHYSYWAGE